MGITRFAETVVAFLTGTLGPVVLVIGIAIAAYSLIFGARDGLQKAIYVIIGGVLLFSASSIAAFIRDASGG